MEQYSTQTKPAIETPPAAAEEAERGVLGCMLADPDYAIPLVDKEGISPRAFDDLFRRKCFRLLLRMHRAGDGIDQLTVESRLKQDPELKAVELGQQISALIESIPSPLNLPFYFPDLKAAHVRRSTWELGHRLIALSTNGVQDLGDIKGDVENALHGLFGAGNNLPQIIPADELVSSSIEKPSEVIRGILHRGSKLALGGGSKTFKTWNLADMAVSVAGGIPWLSFDTVCGRVLYVNLEIQAAFFADRLSAVAKAKGIDLGKNLDVWNLRGHCAEYSSLIPEIRNRVKACGYSLVILDPIYKLYGTTDENSARDVGNLLRAVEDLATGTGAAVAFGAHFAKGNASTKEAIDRISGSGVFARDPDSLLMFTRHEQDEAFAVESILRNFPQQQPFVVRWQFPLMRRDERLDPAKLKKVGGRKKVHTPEALLNILGDQKLTASEWAKQAKEEAGIGNGTFYELLGELRKSERVLLSKIDRTYTRLSKA